MTAARNRFEAMGKDAKAHERRLVAMAIVGAFEKKGDFAEAFRALNLLPCQIFFVFWLNPSI
jgi:hypothetical protein